jgi:hypothetical protein
VDRVRAAVVGGDVVEDLLDHRHGVGIVHGVDAVPAFAADGVITPARRSFVRCWLTVAMLTPTRFAGVPTS